MRFDVIYEVFRMTNPPVDCGATITAAVTSNDDPNVFLIENSGGIPHFLGVCGVPDMMSISASETNADGAIYRTSTITTTLRNLDLVDKVQTMITDDVCALSEALTIADELLVSASADIAYQGDCGDSSLSGYTLSRAPVELYPAAAPKGFRMTIQCHSDDYDTGIFLHRKNDVGAGNSLEAQPIAVCNPVDMVEVPSASPNSEFPWYYRVDVFDIVSYDLSLLLNCWETIKLDASLLAAALAAQTSCMVDSLTESV